MKLLCSYANSIMINIIVWNLHDYFFSQPNYVSNFFQWLIDKIYDFFCQNLLTKFTFLKSKDQEIDYFFLWFFFVVTVGFFKNFYSVYFIIILLYFILHFQRNSGISGDIDIYDYMNTTSLLEKKFHILNFCVQFSIKLIPFQSKLIQVMKKRMHIMDQEIMAKIL